MLIVARVTSTNGVTMAQSIVAIMHRRLLHSEKDVRAKLSQRDYKLHIAARAVSRSIPRRRHKSVHLTQEGQQSRLFRGQYTRRPYRRVV